MCIIKVWSCFVIFCFIIIISRNLLDSSNICAYLFDLLSSKCDVIPKNMSKIDRFQSSTKADKLRTMDSLSGMYVLCLHMAHFPRWYVALQWRHIELDGVSVHQLHDCLLNHLLRRRSKKTSKLHVTGICAGNSPVIGEFPAQKASNAENASFWWRHHGKTLHKMCPCEICGSEHLRCFKVFCICSLRPNELHVIMTYWFHIFVGVCGLPLFASNYLHCMRFFR